MVRTIGVRAVGLVLALGSSSCVAKEVRVGDESGTCENDSDCEQQGLQGAVCDAGACRPSPPATPWGCLGESTPLGTGQPVTVGLRVVNAAASNAPKIGAIVRACSYLDASCDRPLHETTSDANGEALLPLTDDFAGHFEVVSPLAGDSDPEVPVLVFLPPRDIVRGAVGRTVYTFKASEAQALVGFAGGSFNAYLNGVLTATALDCQSKPAAGVSFTLLSMAQASPDTKAFYTNRAVPDATRTETDVSGSFGLTNLFGGAVALANSVNALQQPLASNAGAFVREGWMTQIYVAP